MSLTPTQQRLITLIVKLIREGRLPESFSASDSNSNGMLLFRNIGNSVAHFANARVETFQALEQAGMLIVSVKDPMFGLIDCSVTGKAFEAVDSNFNAPDTSFLRQLTPLADLTTFDSVLKERCLPMLGAGGADQKLWDAAVRNEGVVLEIDCARLAKFPTEASLVEN